MSYSCYKLYLYNKIITFIYKYTNNLFIQTKNIELDAREDSFAYTYSFDGDQFTKFFKYS